MSTKGTLDERFAWTDDSLTAAGFDPDLHPKDAHGRWLKKGYHGWTPAGKGAYGADNATRQKTINQAKERIGDPSMLGYVVVHVDDFEVVQKQQALVDNARAEVAKYEARVRTGWHETYQVQLPEHSGIIPTPNYPRGEWVDAAGDQQDMADDWKRTEARLDKRLQEFRTFMTEGNPDLAPGAPGFKQEDTLRDRGPSIKQLDKVRAMKKAGKAIRTAIDRTMADNPKQKELEQIRQTQLDHLAERREMFRAQSEKDDAESVAFAKGLGYDSWLGLMQKGTNAEKKKYGKHLQALTDRRDSMPYFVDAAAQSRERSRRIFELEDQLTADRREVTLEMLKGHRPMGGSLRYEGAPSARAKTALDFATTYYPAEWIGKAHAIEAIEEPRGYHKQSNAPGNPATIALSYPDRRASDQPPYGAVAVHELGHEMESAVDGLKGAEWAYSWMRASSGDPGVRKRHAKNGHDLTVLIKGRDGKPDEEVRKDKWNNAYSGKEYLNAPQAPWEIFTTGMESIFGGAPEYTNGDTDFQDFVLGALATL